MIILSHRHIVAASLLLFLFPLSAFAALDLITFTVTPETPGPNQAVTVSIQSYAVDLNSAALTWYVDKEVVTSGVGTKSISTMTGDFGKTITVNVIITDQAGVRYDKEFLLKPTEVDLLWEADTFVPPFYKGKALPTYKSLVKLHAIPRFNSLMSDPNIYSYTWTANQTQGLGQGLGKNSVLVPMKYSGSRVPVSVEVSNPTMGGEKGSANKNIVAVDPLLLFYEDAPLLGIRFAHALSGAVSTNGTSFAIHSVPYFFSNDDMANVNLVYAWVKDTAKIAQGLNPNVFVLGKEGTSAQSSTIRLSIQNRKRILQTANAQITVNFAQE